MKQGNFVRDPVCGMQIDPAKAPASRTHMGQTFHFCSPGCAAKFDADPHLYVEKSGI